MSRPVRIKDFEFSLRELAGSMGDFGTLFPIAGDVLAIIGFTVVSWVIAVRLHNRTLPKRI